MPKSRSRLKKAKIIVVLTMHDSEYSENSRLDTLIEKEKNVNAKMRNEGMGCKISKQRKLLSECLVG